MVQRGRKSAAELAIPERFRAKPIERGRRPDPPRHLDAAEAAHWREIVASLPADYFARPYPSQWLLAELCAYIVHARFIDRLLDDCRNTDKLDPEYERLHSLQCKVSNMIVRLHRALGFHKLLSTQPSQRPVLPAPWHRQ